MAALTKNTAKKTTKRSKKKTFTKKTNVDLHALVTAQLIEDLEKGINPWACSWNRDKEAGLPLSAVTGLEYNGINILALLMAAEKKGSRSWITFKKAKELGGNVIKGERSSMAFYYKPQPKKDDAGNIMRDEEGKELPGFPVLKKFAIFNLDQIENLNDEKLKAAQLALPATTEEFLAATGAEIHVTNGTAAFFEPSTDRIVVPARTFYESDDEYYATVFHELTHWSGAKTRLNRDMEMDKESYAFEELVAELGSMYLIADFGLKSNHANHASYIGSWLKALKNDKRFIFKASTAASEARKFLHGIKSSY